MDIPSLTPNQLNCADTKLTDDSGLSKVQAGAVANALIKSWNAKARSKRWTHGAIVGKYVLAFCGITRNGRHFVIVDGIYEFFGTLICDDAAGFGVVFDPKTNVFGDIVFAVNSCAPHKSK